MFGSARCKLCILRHKKALGTGKSGITTGNIGCGSARMFVKLKVKLKIILEHGV